MSWLPSCPMFPAAGTIGAPPGWRDLMKRRPDLSSSTSTNAVMAMTAARFMRLSQVQTGVNQRVKYVRDLGDDWRVADTEGDCEDFALAKMVRLLGYGWPRGALRMAICVIPRPVVFLAGQENTFTPYHAVLQVDTDHGTWVLDNRMKYPRRWTRLPYRWLYRECPGREDWERADVA